MRTGAQEQEKIRIGTADLAPLPWLAVFDQDLSARVLSAVSYGPGFVILSDPVGIPPTQVSHIVERLHEAGLASTRLSAPLASLSTLQDAIRAGMSAAAASQRPLVVVIQNAEALSEATVGRLAELAELRRDGRPVLRFLLAGTPGLWPVLQGAGLGHLEEDVAAHIRPGMPKALHPPEAAVPVFPASVLPRILAGVSLHAVGPDRQAGRLALARAGLAGIGLAAIGLAGIVAAAWFILSPGGAPPRSVPPRNVASGPVARGAAAVPLPASPPPAAMMSSPDERFAALLDRERKEIAADHLSSPPGDNLIETRRQLDAVLPLLSGQTLHRLTEASGHDAATTARHPADRRATTLPAPAAAAPAAGPADDAFGATMHVTLRYSLGDSVAQARAMRMLARLRSEGTLADGPEPTAAAIGRSSLSYYFAQDHDAAIELGQRLVPGIEPLRKPIPASAASDLPRPGEISISIGSRNDAIDAPAAPGKQT